jgi:hypothetical protein
MRLNVGQVWQDDADILFITEISHSDDRLKVVGVAIICGIVTNYSQYALEESFQFGRLMFDPSGDMRIWLDRSHATV